MRDALSEQPDKVIPLSGKTGDSLAPTEPTSPLALDTIRAINQRIFDTSLDLIVVVDRRGKFLRVSPSSLAILGHHPEEMVGRSGIDFIFEDDLEKTREEMRLARRGLLTRNFDCRYVRKDGHPVSLNWTGIWVDDQEQHFFIGRDMTERLKLEAQLRHAQKMESIGQLTGGIAHDFNNLLTVISGTSEILAEATSDPRLQSLAATIRDAADHGAQLTQRMLAFARKQPLQSRDLDLNEIVTRTADALKRMIGEDISLKCVLTADLWSAVADPSQVEDALLNLVVNARDAMPNGGRLMIETANVHLDGQYASQNTEVAAGDYAAVIVTDSGTGMLAEVIERAFEPFFTTKEVGEGTGLGLSMVYGFMKQSRGHIKIYSEIGHGTSIKLYFPRGQNVVAAVAAETVAEVHRQESGTILVVEDSSAVRRVVCEMLHSLGYKIIEAEDSNSALSVLRSGQPIDLLFTDMILPKSMTGAALLREARKLKPDLRAVFTSGYSEHFIKAREETDANVPLLSKPYRKQHLAEVLRKALN
jgi:PAS domain S-box-containing protein